MDRNYKFPSTCHLSWCYCEAKWGNRSCRQEGGRVVEPLDENESRFTKRLRGLIVTRPLPMMMSRTPARHFNGERSNSAPSQARACCLLAAYPHSGKAFVRHSNAQSSVAQLLTFFNCWCPQCENRSRSISLTTTKTSDQRLKCSTAYFTTVVWFHCFCTGYRNS